MAAIRNKRELKAYIKKFFTPFASTHGILDVEDVRELTQQVGAEKVDGQTLSFPYESAEMDEYLYSSLISFLTKQGVESEVLERVKAMKEQSTPRPEKDGAAVGMSSAEHQSKSEPSPAASTTTPSMTFTALKMHLKKKREEQNMDEIEGGVKDQVADVKRAKLEEQAVADDPEGASTAKPYPPGDPADPQKLHPDTTDASPLSARNSTGEEEIETGRNSLNNETHSKLVFKVKPLDDDTLFDDIPVNNTHGYTPARSPPRLNHQPPGEWGVGHYADQPVPVDFYPPPPPQGAYHPSYIPPLPSYAPPSTENFSLPAHGPPPGYQNYPPYQYS